MDLGVLVVLGDAGEQVVAVAEHLGLGLQPDARGDVALVGLAVVAGDEQHRRHAALAIVVGRLQKHGRLAGIHGRVVEVELGHATPLKPQPGARQGVRAPRLPRKKRFKSRLLSRTGQPAPRRARAFSLKSAPKWCLAARNSADTKNVAPQPNNRNGRDYHASRKILRRRPRRDGNSCPTSAAFAGDPESCKAVRFSDVGWTDIRPRPASPRCPRRRSATSRRCRCCRCR